MGRIVVPKEKYILDACCGSKMFWFDKSHPNVIFADIRTERHTLCDGRDLNISPDIEIDFTQMPFEDNQFSLVIFDPPHLRSLGKSSYMAKKYGVLGYHWRHDIKHGFEECMRVLRPEGTLIFKWNETQISTSEIRKLIETPALIGHPSGRASKTIWLTFTKPSAPCPAAANTH